MEQGRLRHRERLLRDGLLHLEGLLEFDHDPLLVDTDDQAVAGWDRIFMEARARRIDCFFGQRSQPRSRRLQRAISPR
jgi:hypothetical protein